MSLLTKCFLRLYGFNLGRSFRNTPEKACSDAQNQLSMVLVLPLGALLIPITLMASRYWIPRRDESTFMLIAAVIVVLPVIFWVQARFKDFVHSPEAADPFRSSGERIKTVSMLVGYPLLFATTVCAIAYVIGLRMRAGS